MCRICGAIIGHHPSCPLTEDRPIATCECCGEPIYTGESVWTDPNGNTYHVSCFEDNVLDVIRDYGFEREDEYEGDE